MTTPGRRLPRQAGLAPGTLVHIGEKHVEKPRIMVMDYDDKTFQEKEVAAVEECYEFKETATVTWIDVDGLHDVGIIERLGNRFGLHPLIQEDILNTAERPKMEDYGDYIFVLLKVFVPRIKNHDEKIQQVSLVLGSNFVISFQENESGRLRPGQGPDPQGQGTVEEVGRGLPGLFPDRRRRGRLFHRPGKAQRPRSSRWRMSWSPIRSGRSFRDPRLEEGDDLFAEVGLASAGGRQRPGAARVAPNQGDHGRSFCGTSTTTPSRSSTPSKPYRDMLSGMLDIYLSSICNRMNEVMKVLTIIATIFIPLTFIAGIYGMNFKFMPELEWRGGYFMVVGVMVAVAIVMLFFFRKKKWL